MLLDVMTSLVPVEVHSVAMNLAANCGALFVKFVAEILYETDRGPTTTHTAGRAAICGIGATLLSFLYQS